MKNEIKQFIGVAVCKFRKSVLQRLEEVRIKNLTINPYLPSVVCGSPKEAIKYSLNGFMGKSNQTKFGSLFEDISIKVCSLAYGENVKTGMSGIDLDLLKGKRRLLISIKSSDKWGNSQSIAKQGDQFKKAKKTINQNDTNHDLISVMGICCGNSPTKDLQYADVQISGQNFWCLITDGEENFYQEILDVTSVGATEFEQIFNNEIELSCVRLLKEYEQVYGGDIFISTIDAWKSIAKNSCGNKKDNDNWMKKIMDIK
jgi:hypothetical protein